MWQIIRKNYKQNFISTVLFFIIGLLNLLVNYFTCRLFHPINILIGFTPFLLLSIFLFMFYKSQTRKGIRTAVNVITIILSCILIVLNFGGLIASEIFDTNNSLSNYPRLIRLYKYNAGYKHYPNKIPEWAKNVKLKEWAPFMQGGGGMYLSYDINKEQEENIDKEFGKKSKLVFENITDVRNASKEICLESDMADAIGDNQSRIGCDKFIMYVLEARNTSGQDWWNHGIEYGVIINKDKHRVTYFNEDW